MTPLQWLFHYSEIVYYEIEKRKQDNDKIGVITDYLELVGLLANPQAGSKWQEYKKLKAAQEEISPEQFESTWEEIKAAIPTELIVTKTDVAGPYFLPKYHKESQPEQELDDIQPEGAKPAFGIKIKK